MKHLEPNTDVLSFKPHTFRLYKIFLKKSLQKCVNAGADPASKVRGGDFSNNW